MDCYFNNIESCEEVPLDKVIERPSKTIVVTEVDLALVRDILKMRNQLLENNEQEQKSCDNENE